MFEVMEDAATELVLGEVAEEAFDHVEPRGRGGSKAHVESPVLFDPALDPGMLVGRRVVADQVNPLASRL